MNNREQNPEKTDIEKPMSAKQHQAILLLAEGYSAGEVSNRLKIACGTVHNWKSQNDTFRRQLLKVQREMFSSGVEQLKSLVSVAAFTLANVMNDRKAAHRDKIAAARTVLQHCDRATIESTQPIKGHEDVDTFIERMELH
jgi:hypothetical protein